MVNKKENSNSYKCTFTFFSWTMASGSYYHNSLKCGHILWHQWDICYYIITGLFASHHSHSYSKGSDHTSFIKQMTTDYLVWFYLWTEQSEVYNVAQSSDLLPTNSYVHLTVLTRSFSINFAQRFHTVVFTSDTRIFTVFTGP